MKIIATHLFVSGFRIIEAVELENGKFYRSSDIVNGEKRFSEIEKEELEKMREKSLLL